MPISPRLLDEIVELPYPAMAYRLSERIHSQFPTSAVLETEDDDFKLTQFAEAGGCAVTLCRHIFGHSEANWRGNQVRFTPATAALDVEWRGHRLLVVQVMYDEYAALRSVIVADSPSIAEQFFTAVCRFNGNFGQSILVMSSDGFTRDDDLLENLRSATWESLNWLPELQADLQRQCVEFFSAREVYAAHQAPWKRGVLLHGPPGNGKTHAIKALINRLNVPVVYVRTFQKRRSLESDNIQKAFARARELAPCLLVLEDLDSLVGGDTMSFFLNEMDGFRSNQGLLTIATTNHLEDIDPALTQRPSRFDRKILVENPSPASRLMFLEQNLGIADPAVVDATDGFSIAFLAELSLSVRMDQLLSGETGPLSADRIWAIVTDLRQQISQTEAPAKTEDADA
jgi:hypothetical protein